MTLTVAIDPGSAQSAIVVYCPRDRAVLRHHLEPNAEAFQRVANLRALYPEAVAVCELTRPYALHGPKGAFFPAQVQDATLWAGRFWGAWGGDGWHLLDRRAVKLALLGRQSGGDSDVRDAILDRFGGRVTAVGRKAQPGPLYGISRDEWAALAVALAWEEIRSTGQHQEPAPTESFPQTASEAVLGTVERKPTGTA